MIDQAALAAAALHEGMAAHRAGQLQRAESLYRQVIQVEPAHAQAMHLLSIAALQGGRHQDAIRTVQQALTLAPTDPTMWNTLGAAQQGCGKLDDAAHAFGRAVALQPDYTEGWANLAITQSGRADLPAEAVALERLTALDPARIPAWNRRGIVAYLLGQLDEAAVCLQQYLALNPADADAWANLAAVRERLGQPAEAEIAARNALALQPGHAFGLKNLASALLAQGRPADALPILEAVVQQEPENAEHLINLGAALKTMRRFADALPVYERAVRLAPHSLPAVIGLGDALQGTQDYRGALACYERARAARPNDPDLHERAGLANQGLGLLPGAAAAFRRCLELAPDRDRVHVSLIFALDHEEGQHHAAWEQRLAWNASISARTRSLRRPHPHNRTPDRPLRVGYVSADFRAHSAAYLFLPVLRSHDRRQVTVYCYSNVKQPDEMTERFQAVADVWRDALDLSDDDLDVQIRADQIDVLVDLSGHTLGNRLAVFAREPAPVQMTAWGYATGTGLETMHYFLADEVVVPLDARQWYREEIVALPSLLCYEPPYGLLPLAPPPALARGHVTFGAFNRIEKVTPNVRAAWARVMTTVPDARLLVKLGGPSEQAHQQLIDELVAHGVAPERIDVRGRTSQIEHLAAHNDVDILLDTFPHGGGVTSVEALLMGVPVITVAGERVAGRLAASFLTSLGLTDLIAETPDAYVEIAARLAADCDRLAQERTTLRERVLAAPFGNAEVYTRHVEAAYRTLWQRWCAGDARQVAAS